MDKVELCRKLQYVVIMQTDSNSELVEFVILGKFILPGFLFLKIINVQLLCENEQVNSTYLYKKNLVRQNHLKNYVQFYRPLLRILRTKI